MKRMSACKSISTLLLSTTILTGMSVTAFSQQAEFVGPGFNWSDPENWSTRTVPDSATDVVIDKLDAVIDFPGANAKTVVVKNGNHLGIVGPSSTLNTKVIDLSLNGQVGFSDGVTANNEAIFSKLQAGDVEVITSEVRKKILSGSLQPLHHSVIFNNGSNAGNGKISLNGRSVLFANRASADHAEIELSQGGAMTLESGSKAGSAVVRNSASLISLQTGSTLENASVNNVDDGLILFYKDSSGGAAEIYNSRSQILLADQSTLGTATVTNDADSLVLFGNQSHGASATVINKNGATIQAGPTKTSPMEIGSLSGAGDVYLGDQSLVTGGLGKNDTISGSIRDGFSEAYRRHQLESGVSTGTGPLSSNGLRKVGAGTLTLTGTNTFSGGTTVEAGTLKLGDGGTSGSILGDINNEAILVFDRSDDVTSANSISGTGEIIQAGSGSLLLTGDSSDFAGQTTVRNGALLVGKPGSDGALGGNLSVLEGARLGGSGIVGSGTGSLTSILSGGTLAAGNSIGTLTIDGDLKMASGSNFETEITSDGRSDLVNVTGKANLAGSNIRIVSVDADTSYQTERSYRILNADSGVNGLFSDTLSSSAFLNAELVYAPKSVDLKIALANDPGYLFPTVAETSNQLATARGLDTLAQSGSSLALYNDLLMLNADEARASFDRLSGEAYATAAGVLVDQSHFVRGAMNGRMQQAFGQSATTPAQESNPYFAWTTSYGSWGSYDGNSLFGDVSSSIGGFASGIDVDLFDTWRVGIMAGYGHSSFDVNERSSSGDSKNYTLGTYAASQWTLSESSALNFRSGLAHTWHDLSMNRNVAFPGFSDRLSSEYDASALQLFGEVGYELNMDRTIFEPYANAGFVRFNSDEFGEAGRTAASLSVTSATMNTWFTTIGLRAATELDIGETLVTARGDIGWRHSYGDVTPTSTASFVGSETFTVSGAPIARDVALIEAGFDIHFTKSAKLGVSYNGQFGSGTINNGVNAKFSVKF